MGSRPPIRAWDTCVHGSWPITPVGVGDPIEPVVVERDDDAVGRRVHVGLEWV